ncbi:hypothetical protein BH10PSE1_BH10PSE1_27030 [soil metagenome]
MRLVAPDPTTGRVKIADWLELLALFSDRGRAPISSIRSLIRRSGDDRLAAVELDLDADVEGEPEITERAADDIEERVVEELEFRAATLGDAYPFVIENGSDGASEQLVRRDDWADLATGSGFYAFCLLDSAIREKTITVPKGPERAHVTAIGKVFQICACMAVGGYLNADVVSFGFPRATGDAFLPALKATWERYGSFKVLDEVPYGFDDALKDAGIDIIAWRKFPDPFAATFLMMVQVASGLNWKDKAVGDDIRAFKNWFHAPRFENVVPAMCIPFPLWFDLDEPPSDDEGNKLPFSAGVATKFEYREARFGIIFDRGRIALCSAAALALPQPSAHTIDGLDQIGEISTWISEVHDLLAERRQAA